MITVAGRDGFWHWTWKKQESVFFKQQEVDYSKVSKDQKLKNHDEKWLLYLEEWQVVRNTEPILDMLFILWISWEPVFCVYHCVATSFTGDSWSYMLSYVMEKCYFLCTVDW